MLNIQKSEIFKSQNFQKVKIFKKSKFSNKLKIFKKVKIFNKVKIFKKVYILPKRSTFIFFKKVTIKKKVLQKSKFYKM